MSCNGTTGLVTNGNGGYLNAGGNMPALVSPTGTTYMMQGNYATGEGYEGGNVLLPQGPPPVTVADINNASNSFTDAGGNPVYANPNLPAVTEDQCNAIKCGASPNNDPATVYACSQSYGAGVWDLCTDARCAPYRGSSCNSATPVVSAPTTVPTYASQFPSQPLTPTSLTTPLPDVTGGQNWGVAPAPVGPDMACTVAQWINNNPLIACAMLGALVFLVKK
jgi:hypothetical protein